ncbi:MAG TPA: RNB domain-containing ribonuclease [Aeromicrobium sp.]|nr:RNB domain-containing ribonuclease [Aeromicrobium sp.]
MGDFEGIRDEFELPSDFPAEVLAEADRVAALPIERDRVDLTHVPFVTIDPPGSMDLDQAMHLARTKDGWRVQYAIADLGAVIKPGSAIDAEARRRGQTLYLPDARVPLHPPVLSEDALSLLPDQDRRAAVWTIDVKTDGSVADSAVERAVVRSVARLDYDGVQADLEAGRAHPSIEALPDLGLARRAHRVNEGAIELGIPEQEVVRAGDRWELAWRPRVPVDGANAEVSLLTGSVAAQMMLKARIGMLRTLPEPRRHDVREFLARAREHGVRGDSPAEVIESLHGSNVGHLALMQDATSLLRGAGYEAFDGKGPTVRSHAGIGEPYAHVTAPLRRLADRFGTEVCLALAAGQDVDPDIRAALPELPNLMDASDSRASDVDRAVIDQVEAWSVKVGQQFPAVVMRANDEEATVMLRSPAVVAACDAPNLTAGTRVTVEVADVTGRTVRFRVAR